MKKSDGEHFLELMKEMMEKIQKMPKEQRDEIGQLLNGELDLSAVENERFYTYQRPDYSKKKTVSMKSRRLPNATPSTSKRAIRLLHKIESK